MTYVKRNDYGGFDWHDIKSFWTQLKENGKYEINNVEKIIVKDIANFFPFLNESDIYDAITNKTTFKFEIKEKKILDNGDIVYEDGNTWTMPDGSISYENEGTFDGNKLKINLSYCWGQWNYETIYYIYDVDAKDICYIVENCFYSITKGCSLIERIYHEPFRDLKEAKKYLSELKKMSYSRFKRKWNNDKIIIVADYNKITSTDWYKHNMEAIKLMKDKKQTILDKSFSPFLETHITNLESL